MSLTAAAVAAMSIAALTEHRTKLKTEADALAAAGDWTPDQEARAAELADDLKLVNDRFAASEKRTRLAALAAGTKIDPEASEERSMEQRASKKYLEEWRGWLRGGPEPELREVLTTSSSGVLVPKQYEDMILKYVDAGGVVRNKADFKGGVKGYPVVRVNTQQSRDYSNFWATEATPGSGTSEDQAVSEVAMKPEVGFPESTVSTSALQAADTDLEAEVIEDLGRKIAKGLEYAYEVGSGSGQPTGVFLSDSNTVQLAKSASASSTAWGTQISYVNLTDIAVNQLPAEYWYGAEWYMSQNAYYQVASLVDGNSRPLLTVDANRGQTLGPAMMLLGFPVNICPFAPGKIMAAGSNVPIIFGNLREAFRIREWAGIPLIRDTISSRGRVIFKASPFANSKMQKPKALCQFKITLT